MFKYILEQWKRKKIILSLILVGFVVANLFLSVGTSLCVSNYDIMMDMNAGNPKEQLRLYLSNSERCTTDNLENIISGIGKYGELVFAGGEKVKFGNRGNVATLVVNSNNVKGWTVPVIEGTYVSDTRGEVLIGKRIAQKNNYISGDSITINGRNYRIKGIMGRKERKTVWDNVIMFDYRDYLEFHSKKIERNMHLLLKTGKEKVKERFDIIRNLASKNSIEVYYEDVEASNDGSSLNNSIVMSMISTVLIFLISIINVINLMIYWMIERRKDIAIMKAIGCTNGHILKWIVVEISVFSLTGAIIAIVIQLLGKMFLTDFLIENEIFLNVSIINVLLAIVVSEVSSVVTALVLTKKSLQFNVKDVLASR